MTHRVAPLSPAERFVEQFQTSLRDSTFLELSFSLPAGRPGKPRRMKARLAEIGTDPALVLNITWSWGTKDEVENVPLTTAAEWLGHQMELPGEVQSAMLKTSKKDLQWHRTGKGTTQLTSHRASLPPAPMLAHDRPAQRVLDESAKDWLIALGILDSNGEVKASMSAKYQQINRYLEIVSHHWDELGQEQRKPVRVCDVGCGKGYLTFGLWHALRRIRGLNVEVVGIERRADLVSRIATIATQVGAETIRFETGSIEELKLEGVDVLVALHACNTATDVAIQRGVEAGARMILVAPCCHQEARPLMKDPEPLGAVMRHGLMKERMAEWVTDGLRTLYLEAAGYRTKVIEFTSPEHTPKNLLILAVKTGGVNPQAQTELEAMRHFFGLERQALARTI